ncbi:MAG: preprotein translocase subunit SecG [Clostridia bacterium]|nr:preprotein translocase subunit SecG [Clostridia bacterium]
MITTLEYIIGGLIFALSIALIFCISKQQSKRRGLGNSIAGQGASESYLSRNKIASNEKKLQKLTLILAIVWAALIVVLFCLSSVKSGEGSTSSAADTSYVSESASAATSEAASAVESAVESLVESAAE